MKKIKIERVTDIIKYDYIRDWEKGDIILINTPTGTGKTTFIKDELSDYCIDIDEKILYLSNREALDKQINKSFKEIHSKKELKKIQIYTYQKFVSELKKGKEIIDYNYIVLDEIHFLTSDSTFNHDCEFLYNLFFDESNKLYRLFNIDEKILILMTSTPQTLLELPKIKKEKKNYYRYKQKPNYSYLNVKYFKENDIIIKKIVDDIKENSQNKWIVFVNSKNEGKEILNKLKEKNIKNSFLHSENKTKEFESIVSEEKFDKNVLISTKILETGVNINDEDVKNIVMYDIDRETIIQEIGRVRVGIDKPRKINLYIPLRNHRYFYNIKTNIEKKLDCIKSYNDNPKDFFKKYQYQIGEIPSEIFYLVPLKGHEFYFSIRETSKTFFEEKIKYLKKIIDYFLNGTHSEYSFVLQVLEWLGIKDSFNIDNLIDNEELKNYLEKNLKNKLFNESQLELSSLIKKTFGLSNNKSKKLRINTINIILKKHNINYILKSYVTSKRDKDNKNPKKCSYWIIEKNTIYRPLG